MNVKTHCENCDNPPSPNHQILFNLIQTNPRDLGKSADGQPALGPADPGSFLLPHLCPWATHSISLILPLISQRTAETRPGSKMAGSKLRPLVPRKKQGSGCEPLLSAGHPARDIAHTDSCTAPSPFGKKHLAEIRVGSGDSLARGKGSTEKGYPPRTNLSWLGFTLLAQPRSLPIG